MRGKPIDPDGYIKRNRNIPAYAGKTGTRPDYSASTPEHPRVCGENKALIAPLQSPQGTSPRMRGKQTGAYKSLGINRNIPAYAGKTTPRRPHFSLFTEHPRVCGENVNTTMTSHTCSGTSPRMRGKRPSVRLPPRPRRNIPAYAGKTPTPDSTNIRGREHPRVCGENFGPGFQPVHSAGTSPRMRGKPSYGFIMDETKRNIPAYAGKTPV